MAGLASRGQNTLYVCAKVASGIKQVSIAIVDNAYAGYLAGPTSITLTTAWQRSKITGTLAGGQTGLWIVVWQFAGNGDSALSFAEITTEPQAIPAATSVACDAHVRAYPFFGSLPCCKHAPQR